MGSALYNEIEPFACEWLGNLIAGGHIAAGEVDARSIAELDAARLAGVVQAHFFAGIGGWSAALRLTGWPDDRAVWTASCPCQPFSSAGKRGGFGDERHLWPVLFALIRECRPAVLFGEQVASRDGLAWFDAVHADLEGAGYTVGAADLCAAGVGAPHIRQRLYFVALADAEEVRCGQGRASGPDGFRAEQSRRLSTVGCGMGDGHGDGIQRDAGCLPGAQEKALRHVRDGGIDNNPARSSSGMVPGPCNGHWAGAEWIACTDGKTRPTEPGIYPLAHGVPGRVGRLRGYGNAIVPQIAAAFIRAVMDEIDDRSAA